MCELFVGNLPYTVTEDDIRRLLAPYGPLYSIELCKDALAGWPHTFAFVRMEFELGEEASEALHGTNFMGNPLHVEMAEAERSAVW